MSTASTKGRKKLEEAIVYILSFNSIEILRLAKLLYLSDYMFAKTFGKHVGITGQYERMQYGPVPEYFYPVINDLTARGVIKREVNNITLLKPQGFEGLSEEEKACIDKVVADFFGLSLEKVMKVAYSTEPMVEILRDESTLDTEKGLVGLRIDFHKVPLHPLMEEADTDLSFMDTPEYQQSLVD